MSKAELKFGETHGKGFSIHIGQGIFPVGAESFRNVVLVPGEDADGSADGNKVQADLHLTAEPDVVAHHAIFGRIGATFPNLATKEE